MCRPFSPRSTDGFSVVEMMVALTVSLVVTAAVLALAVSSRNLYASDQARSRIDQDLRASRDFLTADILRAGENLGSDFPAVEIVDGGAGPDTLALRRNLLEIVLPVCDDLSGTDTTMKIAETIAPPAGCDPLADGDADGWPDNLQAWRDRRAGSGGTHAAYIYNPTTGNGEFFEHVAEDAVLFTLTAAPGTVWNYTYPVTDQCRLYVLEERRYELGGGLLQVILDQHPAAPVHVADGLEVFQAVAVFQDGTRQDSLGFADVWNDLAAIELRLQAGQAIHGRGVAQAQRFEIMPRNILSN